MEKASKIAKNNHFQTPIDEIDAAARILDPVFTGVAIDLALEKDNNEEKMDIDEVDGHTERTKKQTKQEKEEKKSKKGVKDYGKFFKDYRETEW